MNLVVPMLALTVGTMLLRMIGPLLRSRVTLSPRIEMLSSTAVAVLFVALVATQALIVDTEFAGFALPAGVVVAAVLAWRKAPFVAIVVAASATTAALRFVGVA
ncbi:AzlD domain-containing protein [Rhodococcus sp. H36-A4]|uniref:AzlD domain-containing protein n=1 Tax=Rhodococcus sp. H36-A4 TaxID=3004353 RepID=UPI0022AFDEA3|nr:AzlD domain-containing protein [Rhodococcus sp. H36-A4]MCZ4077415.1 AzlD domain-containing protein [Rhodococcus sp. H36-A4]